MATPKTPKQIDIKLRSLRKQIAQLQKKRKKAVADEKKKKTAAKKRTKKKR